MKLQLICFVVVFCIGVAASMYRPDGDDAAFESDFNMEKRQDADEDAELSINARASGCESGYDELETKCSTDADCGRTKSTHCGDNGRCCKRSEGLTAVE